MKIWHWILLSIFLVMVFLFRFKYMTVGTAGFLRINRITGIAKVYKWNYSLGKYELYKSKHKSSVDLDKILKKALEKE